MTYKPPVTEQRFVLETIARIDELAALPGFTLPGDTSASDRYYRVDVTEPFVLQDGQLPVPTGPGIGVDPLPEVMADLTVWSTELRLGG